MSDYIKTTADQATEHGYIDAVNVINHPEKYDTRARFVAIQHINRYVFARRLIKNKKVIDAACGAGYGCEVMRSGGYGAYTGIDINKEAIEIARERYKDFDNVIFIEDDVAAPKNYSSDERFDVFISFETIEHVDDYNSFLKFIAASLKEGGDFVISTPNRDITNPGGTLQDGPRWDRHIREWNLEEFIELLRNHDFRIEKISGQSFYLRGILKIIPGLRTFVKNITQSILPLFPLTMFAKPNFYVIHCKK